jgi:hypothetical protein
MMVVMMATTVPGMIPIMMGVQERTKASSGSRL